MMEKVPEVSPAFTVTIGGKVRRLELDDNTTIWPPAGAATFKVTVPVEEVPPTTEAGDTFSAYTAGAGFTVNWAVFWTPFMEAAIVTVTGEPTR